MPAKRTPDGAPPTGIDFGKTAAYLTLIPRRLTKACAEPPGATVQPARVAIGTTFASASRPSMAAASSRPHNSMALTCSGHRLAR